MVASESSNSSDNSQGQPDVAGDNPDTAQNLSGQPMAEQHKASAVPAKLAPTEPLRQDIAEQVVPQLKERLDQHDIKAGKQQITLTLSPDSLGEIKMNLNLQGQKLSIEIVTEHRSVREAIMQHVDALKETLARQNITMESFDVTTGGKGSGNQGQNQNAWRELMQQQQQQQQQYWTSSRGYTVAQAVPLSEAAIQQRRPGESMLDIHY
jgi:flagellar hook-length control protein FliK